MIAFLFRNIFLKKDSWQSFLVMLFFIPERDFFLSRTKKQKKAASNALIFAFETAPLHSNRFFQLVYIDKAIKQYYNKNEQFKI